MFFWAVAVLISTYYAQLTSICRQAAHVPSWLAVQSPSVPVPAHLCFPVIPIGEKNWNYYSLKLHTIDPLIKGITLLNPFRSGVCWPRSGKIICKLSDMLLFPHVNLCKLCQYVLILYLAGLELYWDSARSESRKSHCTGTEVEQHVDKVMQMSVDMKIRKL